MTVSIFPQLNQAACWSCELPRMIRLYLRERDHNSYNPSHPIPAQPLETPMATTPTAQKGMILPKESVYKISERCFRDDGRGMVAGKGGGRQRVYFCDQKDQGCSASIRWVKQATSLGSSTTSTELM